MRHLADDPDAMARLREEGARIRPSLIFSGRWDHVHVRYSPRNGDLRDRDLATIADARGEDPVDVLIDIAIADDFETQFAIAMRSPDDDRLGELVAHPAAQLGGSDAGAHTQSNTDSCYAVWTLQHWVRERGVLSLETAVAMLTGRQADLFGIRDRGRIAPGRVRRPRAVRPRPRRHRRRSLRVRHAGGRHPPRGRAGRDRGERRERHGRHA